MKVFVIDDEHLMLEEMHFLLSEYSNIEIVGMYTSALTALEKAEKLNPDTVFMDIDMPGMNGLELAEKIQKKCPFIYIVFITAYSEYALDAYKTYPIDYLLKPIEKERLSKTIERIKLMQLKKENSLNTNIIIKCFGRFEIENSNINKELDNFLNIKNKKEKMLLAYLIYRFNKAVTRKELLYLLFEGEENNKTVNHLHVMIHHIRKMLDTLNVDCSIGYSGGNYMLKITPNICDYVDLVTFLNDNITINSENASKIIKYISFFNHDYLENEDFPWVTETQEWLEKQYRRLLFQLSQFYVQNNNFREAENCLQQLVDRNPLFDEGWQELFRLYLEKSKHYAFIKQYEKYEKILKKELKIKPDSNLTKNYKKFKQEFGIP